MEPNTRLQIETEARPSPLARDAVREAHQWLVRFNPLLDDVDRLSADECRARLELVPSLRDSGDRVVQSLRLHGDADDKPLLETIQGALRELDTLEEDVRRRLARVDPDDPQASVDLEGIQSRLAEAAARREVAEVVGPLNQSAVGFEAQTSVPNWAGALFLGVFAFGWLSFTTVHAFFMIGGMSQAFGWIAFALLAFYAIFFLAGFGMAAAAVMSATYENLAIEGDEVVLTRRLLSWKWQKRHQIGRDSRAHVTFTTSRNNNTTSSNYHAYILDTKGREIKFGVGRPEPELNRLVAELNEYLEARRN
jgi:hypothetical protein